MFLIRYSSYYNLPIFLEYLQRLFSVKFTINKTLTKKGIPMKSLIFAFAFLTIATVGFSQTDNDLKGPAAKNYKPWQQEDKAPAIKVYTSETATKLQGPSAKNKKTWELETKNYQETALVTTRPRVTGPKAKNAKVWSN